MIHGTLLLVATGLCWVLIAVVISTAARRRLDLDFIQAGAALLTAAAAGGALLFQRSASIPLPLQLAVFGAGVGNYLMIKLMNAGMARGHNGAVWGITQSALVFPFTMGMLFFGVAPTVSRLAGLALILAAIVLFSFSKEKKTGNFGQLAPSDARRFFFAGISQCCANLPSYLGAGDMPSTRRALLVQLGVLASFGVNAGLTGSRWRARGTLLPLVTLGCVNIVSLFFLFYRGLNILASLGCGSIGYPVAMGSCIAGFLIYSRAILREKAGFAAAAAFLAVLSGILVISL